MAKLCQVCTTGEAKYKCPACRAPYCSAACYKAHKEVPCAAPAAANVSAAVAAASTASIALASANSHQQQQHPPQPSLSAHSRNSEHHHEELEVDAAQLLSIDQLEVLRALPIVSASVENPAIRALLTKIDTSGNRLKELEKALLDPTFASFMYQTLDQVHAKTT